MASPTQRTFDHLRKQGYLVQVVEKWNPWARKRQDLFGIIDVLAVRDGETLAVQCCSGGDVSSRVKKIVDSPTVPFLRRAGWKIVVHGWRKLKSGWAVREVDCS